MAYVDNYDDISKGITRFILDNAPDGLRAYDRKTMEQELQSDEGFRNMQCMEFQRGDLGTYAECSLYVKLEPKGYEFVEDDEGNLWYEYDVNVEVSWPSWGGTEPGLAMYRVQLMSDVCAFANVLKNMFTFQPVMRLRQTKAERDEATRLAAEEKAKKELTSKLQAAINDQNLRTQALGRFEGRGLVAPDFDSPLPDDATKRVAYRS